MRLLVFGMFWRNSVQEDIVEAQQIALITVSLNVYLRFEQLWKLASI